MKIGILTFHYSSNQGSVLQAFCTYNLLKDSFPKDQIEIINLIPLTREFFEIIFLSKSFPFLNTQKFSRYIQLRKFLRSKVKLSIKRYFDSLDKQQLFINNQNYDFIITGSDTVWFHSKKLKYQIPNIYFLPSNINANKIAFSVSVDPLNKNRPYLDKMDQLNDIFQNYLSITVRDRTTQDLLWELGNIDSKLLIDPTLLYDFENKLKIRIPTRKIVKNIKRIGLGIADRKLTNVIVQLLGELGDFTIFDFFSKHQKSYDYIFDELNMYPTFDVLISDRFHRTIFSLKLSNALTIYIENIKYNKFPNSKGRDLLSRIGLSDCIIQYSDNEIDIFKERFKECLDNWSTDVLEYKNSLLSNFKNYNKSLFNDYVIDIIKNNR